MGNIDLTLRTGLPQYNVGDSVSIGVYAQANLGEAEGMLSFQMIFNWDITKLRLLSVSTVGGQPFTAVGFFHDAYGINEVSPPLDGSAILIGLGPLGSSIMAQPSGTLLTTMMFTALAPSAGTPLSILPSGGSPMGTTVVYGDAGPNVNVNGTHTGTSVTIIPAPITPAMIGLGFCFVGRRRRDAANTRKD
jgi:hypothetical protein